MSIEIELVETKKQLKQFIKVAWDVYKDDPNWVPWLWFERLQFFDRSHNPFFEHAEAEYYIARRDGKAVGSIAAILNHRHNEVHEENIAHFGIFEVHNDPEAASALLETACEWAREKGTDKILGPANFSSTMEWGTLIEGFDSPPVILMTYNPRYYIDFIEAAGFTKAMDLYAWNTDLFERMKPGGLPEKLVRVVNKVPKRYGLTIRTVDMKNWDSEVALIKKIYNQAWEKNWGFVPLTSAEFDAIESELKPIIDPNIVFFVEKDGETVGFSLSLPDANQIIHKLRPGTTVIGSYIAAGRMLLMKKQINRLRVFAFGVLEEYRGKGVDAMMYYETFKAALAHGYQWGEASWILENNEAMNAPIRAMNAELYKRYRVYEKSLK
jgi:GNAT superfamily N-acetyltransferase